MNKPAHIAVFAVLSVLANATAAHAHAVHIEPIAGGYGIRATHDDGVPVASAEIRVWAPDNNQEPFQEGWTDAKGCFVFHPSTSGTWRIEMDDGMGHAAQRSFAIDPDGLGFVHPVHLTHRVQGLITGVSVIFGLFGLYALWRSRSAGRGTS